MSTPLFEVRNLTKIYGGGLLNRQSVPALDDFSLTFAEDDPKVTTIAGESGSGKTTLANLALGFIHPTAGQINYNRQDIWQMSRRERFHFRREVQASQQEHHCSSASHQDVHRCVGNVARSVSVPVRGCMHHSSTDQDAYHPQQRWTHFFYQIFLGHAG